MTVIVNYDPTSTLVLGYYRDCMQYNLIPTPNVSISDATYFSNVGNQMCVVNGVYQPYVTPTSTALLNAKNAALATLHNNRVAYQTKNITISGVPYVFLATNEFYVSLSIAVDVMTINKISFLVWCDVNYNPIQLTPAQAQTLQLNIFNQVNSGYQKEWAIIPKINACTTVAQVQAISLTIS